MGEHESKSERYRRLAQECLEAARTVQSEQLRLALIEMAQVWMRVADEKQKD